MPPPLASGSLISTGDLFPDAITHSCRDGLPDPPRKRKNDSLEKASGSISRNPDQNPSTKKFVANPKAKKPSACHSTAHGLGSLYERSVSATRLPKGGRLKLPNNRRKAHKYPSFEIEF